MVDSHPGDCYAERLEDSVDRAVIRMEQQHPYEGDGDATGDVRHEI